MVEMVSNKTVKARKDYKCNWCGGKIKKGHVYLRQALKDDTFYTWRAHPLCQEFASDCAYECGFDEDIPPFSDWDVQNMHPEIRRYYERVINAQA